MIGAVPFGKDHSLRYDLYALSQVQEKLGKPLDEVVSDDATLFNPNTLLTLIWAGLLHQDETLTLRQASLIAAESFNVEGQAEKVGEALQAAFPDKGEDEGKPEAEPE